MGCSSSRGTSTMPQQQQHSTTYVHRTTYAMQQPQPIPVMKPQPGTMLMTTFTSSPQAVPPLAPPPQAAPPTSSKPIEKSSQDIYPEITEEMIGSFQALSGLILSLEQKNIINRLEAELHRQSELEKEIRELNQYYAVLDAKTKKEHQDVVDLKSLSEGQSVSKYFASQYDFDKQLTKEEEELIQAKTEQENCYAQLIKLQEESSKLSTSIFTLKAEKVDLLAQYEKQDEILENIFGGTYGSLLEDQLEEELDKLEDKRSKIKLAMEKWKNAEAVVEAASRQLEFACKRWADIERIPKRGNHQVLKTQVVSEARNYFIAASRNLTNAQRYLHPAKLPYCNAGEVATLNKAINFMYVDAMFKPRHDHAMQTYYITQVRSVMLYKWIHNVVENRISVDLAEVSQKSKDCRQSLRKERMMLMKKKVEEDTGKTIDIDESQINGVLIETNEVEQVTLHEVEEVAKTEDDTKLQEELEKATAENTEEMKNEVDAAIAVAAVKAQEANKTALEDLAPAPTRNELFGNLDTIMAAYDEQKTTLQKEQEAARARQEEQVQMKLRRRRSRKMRLDAQAQISE